MTAASQEKVDSIRESKPGAADLASGGALGLLLALLVGLSISPVVSIVITSLVGLLAALFGLSDAANRRITRAGLRRLLALALTATIALPFAIWIRTHDLLSPTVAQQKIIAREMGYADGTAEQRELLGYMRFGIVPEKTTVATGPLPNPSVLYSGEGQAFCDKMLNVHTAGDLDTLLRPVGDSERKMADKIKSLSEDDKKAAVTYANIFLCEAN